MRKRGTITCLLAVLCLAGKAQIPVSGQFHLEVEELRTHLAEAPLHTTQAPGLSILLPTPEGTQISFEAWAEPLLSDALQAEHPAYHTYTLQNKDANYSGRLLISPAGLDAVLVNEEQVLFIESVAPTSDLHRSYYWKLGPDYLSFKVPEEQRSALENRELRLAVLADDAYVRFHREDRLRAVLASINGLNAILQHGLGLGFRLVYLDQADRMEVLACRTNGFSGRAGEALKLFGDRIADGELSLEDFDLGHLFSGRGFGSNALAAVAGSDAYYDWNEDGVYDGPAKAGAGTGAVRPEGTIWWGNLCQGILRQLRSSDLALSVQRSAGPIAEALEEASVTNNEVTEASASTIQYLTGASVDRRIDFPYLSCLPFPQENILTSHFKPLSSLTKEPSPKMQANFSGGALLPFFLDRGNSKSIRNWLIYWRFR